MARPHDTSTEAHREQIKRFRAMRPEDRLRLADALSTEVRRLADAGNLRRAGRTAAHPTSARQTMRIDSAR